MKSYSFGSEHKINIIQLVPFAEYFFFSATSFLWEIWNDLQHAHTQVLGKRRRSAKVTLVLAANMTDQDKL